MRTCTWQYLTLCVQYTCCTCAQCVLGPSPGRDEDIAQAFCLQKTESALNNFSMRVQVNRQKGEIDKLVVHQKLLLSEKLRDRAKSAKQSEQQRRRVSQNERVQLYMLLGCSYMAYSGTAFANF